ncbi:hypothetical protein BDP55DRAFT_676040 [Colletotrichum godetiae]|uniref:Uncharacterized protein n=1 Tax=Colletotrichum godetiae TaxID=1209918 RepID=A0AAJ0ADP4_9PEZI|nr:uncharacterized protein BDP55DRAFT_676040 [Colletotrichum godetiae]KAK1671390.1 hypothetical protein BDP55DRAFT_676040 [Colletotrichum godetiae]
MPCSTGMWWDDWWRLLGLIRAAQAGAIHSQVPGYQVETSNVRPNLFLALLTHCYSQYFVRAGRPILRGQLSCGFLTAPFQAATNSNLRGTTAVFDRVSVLIDRIP